MEKISSDWYQVANVLIDNIDNVCLKALIALTSKNTMNCNCERPIHPVVLHVLFQLQKHQEADFYVLVKNSEIHNHIRHVYVGETADGRILMWIGDADAVEFDSANSLAWQLNQLASNAESPIIFTHLPDNE